VAEPKTAKPGMNQLELDRKTFELWATIDAKLVAEFGDELPTEMIGNARLTLAGVKSRGLIESFELYETLFEQVWERITKRSDIKSVTFIIAAGAPRLPGIALGRAADDDSSLGYLTIGAQKTTIARWQPEWLIREVTKGMRGMGVKIEPNAAQIHCLWLHAAVNGEPIRRAAFGATPTLDQVSEGKEYLIRTFRTRQEVDIVFASFKTFRSKEGLSKLIASVKEAVYRLATDPGGSGYYLLLNENIEKTISRCRQGVQALGLQLPVSVLGAVTLRAALLEGDIVKGIPPGSGALFVSIIREMLTLESASFTKEWLADRFLTPVASDSIVELMAILKNRGFVERPPKSEHWQVSDNIVFAGYRICGRKSDEFHNSALNAAAGAIATVDSQRFGFHSVRYCISEDKAADLAKLIKDFREMLVSFARGQTAKDQVYQINMQLFPITRLSPDYRRISLEKHRLEAEAGEGPWITPVVYDLVNTTNFRYDPKWVAGKLIPAVTVAKADATLELLKNLGCIAMDPIQNRFVQTTTKFEAPAMLTADAQREFHSKMVELAGAALSSEDFPRREFSTLILALREDSTAQIRNDIKTFMQDMANLSAKSFDSDQVYQLNLQMFPHSK